MAAVYSVMIYAPSLSKHHAKKKMTSKSPSRLCRCKIQNRCSPKVCNYIVSMAYLSSLGKNILSHLVIIIRPHHEVQFFMIGLDRIVVEMVSDCVCTDSHIPIFHPFLTGI